MDMRKEVTIRLDFPVQLADRQLCEVTMRRPKMKDMLKHNVTSEISIGESVALMADLCGLLPDDLDEFDVSDYEKLQKQLLSFRGVDQ